MAPDETLAGVDAPALARAAALLRDGGVPDLLETIRQKAIECAHEPWLGEELVTRPGGDAGALLEGVHLGRPERLPVAARDTLAAAGLIAEGADGAYARFHLTAFRGLLVVGEHHDLPPTEAGTYVGQDGLRLVDHLVAQQPSYERALDIGCGSGILSAALARIAERVEAFDIDPRCREATLVTGALNGVEQQISVGELDATKDLEEMPEGSYDFITVNPPGSPIPPGVEYHAAGRGGLDGLLMIRPVMRESLRLLQPGGRLVMRFEASGDESGPFLLSELREFAAATGADALVQIESRIPMIVRNATSTRWAAEDNPQLTTEELLARFDEHAAGLGASYFYTCTLLARRTGEPKVATAQILRPLPTGVGDAARLLPHARTPDTAQRYGKRLMALPDGLSELDVARYADVAFERLPQLIEAGGETLAIEDVFSDLLAADPVHARTLHVLAALALDSCAEAAA